jgi:hypothetical protein
MTALDLFGVGCLALFAWFVWPPVVLVVLAVAAFAASWVAQRGDGS